MAAVREVRVILCVVTSYNDVYYDSYSRGLLCLRIDFLLCKVRALNYGKSLPDTDRQRERERERGGVEFCFSCIVCHSHYRNTKIPKYQICTLIFQFRNVFAVISRFIAQQRDSSRLIRLLSRYLNCLARLVVIWRKSLFKMIKSGTWKWFPIAF